MTVLLIAAAWITLLSLLTGLCAIARLGDRADSAAGAAPARSELVEPAWGLPAGNFSVAERALAAGAHESSREYAHGRAGSVAA